MLLMLHRFKLKYLFPVLYFNIPLLQVYVNVILLLHFPNIFAGKRNKTQIREIQRKQNRF